jgi:hypothetical protein
MIHDGFYGHPRVRALRKDGKHLFSYLCGNAHSHYSGIYYLPIPDICDEADMTDEEVRSWLWILEDGPKDLPPDVERRPGGYGYLIEYDYTRSVVWVRGMLKRQTKIESLNKKQITGVSNYLTRFMNCPLVGRFIRYYEKVSIPIPKGYRIPHTDTGINDPIPERVPDTQASGIRHQATEDRSACGIVDNSAKNTGADARGGLLEAPPRAAPVKGTRRARAPDLEPGRMTPEELIAAARITGEKQKAT